MSSKIQFDTFSTESEPWNDLGIGWKFKKLKEYEAAGLEEKFADHKHKTKRRLMKEVQDAKAEGKPWLPTTKDRTFYIAMVTFEP